MEKKIILFLFFIAAIHFIAVFYDWYWRFLWIDIPMHFLGGVFVAVVFLWLVKRFPGHFDMSRNFFVTSIFLLGFVALTGILWEFSEFLYDLVIISKGWESFAGQGARDMIGDLFFDLLGGLTIAVFRRLSYNKSKAP